VKLARVVGTVVSTIKSPVFEGRALLLVDLLEPDGREAGGYLIALDTVGAGAGETVLILDEGTSARQIIGAPHGPLRTVVVGIVDAVEGPAAAGLAAAGPADARPAAPSPHPPRTHTRRRTRESPDRPGNVGGTGLSR
jgi:ethanolamine utilization protein EutN